MDQDRGGIIGRARSFLEHEGVRRYSRSTGWMFVTKVLSLMISFFSVAYVVRGLGPENYGQLSFAVSYVSIFSFIATLGIDQVLYRDIIHYPERKDSYLGTAFVLKLLAGFLSVLLCMGMAYASGYDSISFLLIGIISITFIFIPFQIISSEFQAEVKSKIPSIISLSDTIILNLLKIAVIFLGKGIIYMALINLFEAVLLAVLFVISRKMHYKKPLHWLYDKKLARQLLRDSWPMLFANAFALVYARIDQVFIRHLIDAKSVGFYDSAVRISEAWYFIPTIIVTSFFPAIVNARKSDDRQYSLRLGNLAIVLFLLSLIVALPVSAFSGLIMNVIYGPAFLPGAPVLSIYIWSGIGTSLACLVTNYLIAENQRRILFISSSGAMILNVVLNLWLIPKYGIEGSAWATFFSYMVTPLSVFLFSFTRKRLGLILKAYSN